MKVVIQRVDRASVQVNGHTMAAIGRGVLALVGVERSDTPAEAQRLAKHVSRLRLFEDEQGKMNRSIVDVRGEALVVSQFTLAADLSKGTRPSFDPAATPEQARPLIAAFVQALREAGLLVQEGRFGERMSVELVNDGPVTFVL